MNWFSIAKVGLKNVSFGLLVLAASSASLFAETAEVAASNYWSFFSPEDGLNRINAEGDCVPVLIQTSAPFRLVDETSDPKNPFPDSTTALYMEPLPENTAVRIRFRPFAEETPVQGWFEFNVRLVEGTIYLALGTMKQPWISGNPMSFAETRLTDFTFTPNEPVRKSGGLGLGTSEVSELAADQNYVFRVAWVVKEEGIELSFSLNGSQVTQMDGAPFDLIITSAEMDGGVLGFLLGSGSSNAPNATAFFGSVLAKDLSL